MQQLSDPDPQVPPEAYQVPQPAPQRIRFIRDDDGELYIEIPGSPDRFATVGDFGRGRKYVANYTYNLEELEADGPLTIEWDSAAP